MDKYQKLAELLEGSAKVEEIFVESIEETQANLSAHGLDFSIEELQELAKAAIAEQEGELNEEALDNVAGGALHHWQKVVVKIIVKTGIKHLKKYGWI